MTLPTPEHVLFIPAVFLIGMTLGYLMGARAKAAEIARNQARLRR